MDSVLWQDIQESLLYTLAPFLYWWVILLGAGGVLSAIGVVMLGITSRATR